MLSDVYQEYLYTIGKLKDTFNLTVETDHKHIHAFFKDKHPLFKLMYGIFEENNVPSIVVSFHIDINSMMAVQWFMHIQHVFPLLKVTEVYVEDSLGETYLGADARKIRGLQMEQKVLSEWLDNYDVEEIQDFVESEIVGREPGHASDGFDSKKERERAIVEFDLMKKPLDDGEVQ